MKYSQFPLFAALALMAASCVDNKYDLSNLDTTVKINVDNLTIPVQIDDIVLNSIIDLDDNDIVKVVDGVYTIETGGNVEASNIEVQKIHLSAPYVAPTETAISIDLPTLPPGLKAGFTIPDITFSISSKPSSYTFSANNVSSYIVQIDRCDANIGLDLGITLVGVEDYINGVTFNDVHIQLPKGLAMTETAGGVYTPSTGELVIQKLRVEGNSTTLRLRARSINFADIPANDFVANTHTISVTGALYILSGQAVVTAADLKPGITTIPSLISLKLSYDFDDIDITSFTGKVQYDITGIKIPDVDLNKIPGLFTQEGTSLLLENPCIFLRVHNPLQSYNVYARTGFEITAIRSEGNSTYAIDAPGYFDIYGNTEGSYSAFCLSPESPTNVPAGYENPIHVPYSSLSNVLSGNKVPSTLGIKLTNPCIPPQYVTNFALGCNLGNLEGSYKIIAPLQLKESSVITYTDKVDGWGSEDLDKLTITDLQVAMDVTTDIPVSLEFTAYPIDSKGNVMPNLEITGININANAEAQHVVIRASGDIRDLDGIEYRAVARSIDGPPLSPDMMIYLKNVRPSVTGYYLDKL